MLMSAIQIKICYFLCDGCSYHHLHGGPSKKCHKWLFMSKITFQKFLYAVNKGLSHHLSSQRKQIIYFNFLIILRILLALGSVHCTQRMSQFGMKRYFIKVEMRKERRVFLGISIHLPLAHKVYGIASHKSQC